MNQHSTLASVAPGSEEEVIVDWPSVAACLQDLNKYADFGSYLCRDAYRFLYFELQERADQEETPEELQCIYLPEQSTALVEQIKVGLSALQDSKEEHANQGAAALPLLAVLLNDERCCRALDAKRQSLKVLAVLLKIFLNAGRVLSQNQEPSDPDKARLIPVIDAAFQILDIWIHQHCDMLKLGHEMVVDLVEALRLAVDGRYSCQCLSLLCSTCLSPGRSPTHPPFNTKLLCRIQLHASCLWYACARPQSLYSRGTSFSALAWVCDTCPSLNEGHSTAYSYESGKPIRSRACARSLKQSRT